MSKPFTFGSLFSGIEAASAAGNSMAVPCMRWIGRRIQLVESIMEGER